MSASSASGPRSAQSSPTASPVPVRAPVSMGAYPGTKTFLPILLIVGFLLIIVGAYLISLGTIVGIFGGIFAVLFGLMFLVLLMHAAYSIQPYEIALVTVLGSYKGWLEPGFNVVNPVARVIRVDLRTQVLEVPRQEVITKDNSPTNVDAIIYIKVVDGSQAVFQVQNYRLATLALAQTTLRSVIGDMELDEILYNRETINARLRDLLDEATDKWGVRVEAVEIKEVDPVGPVKAAMEEQTAAERQRRAAVLRSDGEKRSAILVAEGAKRARILQAEGLRQSKILEAEGSRMATILEAQGESQRLRILAMGAATLDAKALTVLSLDTATSMADGQATKILFPFEFSRLMEGASEYLGAGRAVPERAISTLDELEQKLGTINDVLGPIPKQEELTTEIQSIEDEIKAESGTTEQMINQNRGGSSAHGPNPADPSFDLMEETGSTLPPPPASPSRGPSTTPSVGAATPAGKPPARGKAPNSSP